ncbi:hypothetical protein ANANG_G00210220, partial [Anguilla anguilla]
IDLLFVRHPTPPSPQIRNGNLKAILGLFFSLSRYKQQQQAQKLSHQTAAPSQAGTPSHGTPVQTQGPPHAPAHMQKAQAEMQSRLPGPTARMSAAGSDGKPRASTSAGNRRSQSFNNIDKSKPAPAPVSAHDREPSEGDSAATLGMTERAQTPGPAGAPATSSGASSIPTSSSSSAIPSPAPPGKPWRSKSLVKHSGSSAALSVKQPDPPTQQQQQQQQAPPQRGSKSSGGGPDGRHRRPRPGEGEGGGRVQHGAPGGDGGERPAPQRHQQPQDGPAGIAQRTFSRALTAKKSSPKSAEKDKDKPKEKDKDKPKEKDKDKDRAKEKDRDKDRAKEGSKRLSVNSVKGAEPREEPKEEPAPAKEAEPKKTSKIASFIPKGGKAGSAKKEGPAPAHSGIPKPGSKAPGREGLSGAPRWEGRGEAAQREAGRGRPGLLLRGQGPAAGQRRRPGGRRRRRQHHQRPATSAAAAYSHPNTATVAPFMYRSQTDVDGTLMSESGPAGGSGDPAPVSKPTQASAEDLAGEDPEARRLRTVKNIADLRQNLEETMSSLRGTQLSHSTLETTFDNSVTTEISGRSILSLTSRSAALSRYIYSGPLRRQLVARGSAISGAELGDKADDLDLESIAMDAPGYMSDGDVLSKNVRTDDVTSGYMTDGAERVRAAAQPAARRDGRRPGDAPAQRLHGPGDADSLGRLGLGASEHANAQRNPFRVSIRRRRRVFQGARLVT